MRDGDETVPVVRASDMFLKSLVRQMRANDAYGARERLPDERLLSEFIVSAEQRREKPIIGDPDAKVIWQIEQYYRAVGLAVEEITGVMSTVLISLSSEGFGQAVVVAGRLVLVHRSIRDAHRFGFATVEKLAESGGKLVGEAMTMLDRFPEAARC